MNVYDTYSSSIKKYELLALLLCLSIQLFAQDHPKSILKGVLYDHNSRQPLMYASIFVINSNTGVISNEQGQYAIDISSFGLQDSIRFQYMGYQIKDVAISDLLHSADVDLEENSRHEIATVVVDRGYLYTLAASTSEQRWSKMQDTFKRVVSSFTFFI